MTDDFAGLDEAVASVVHANQSAVAAQIRNNAQNSVGTNPDQEAEFNRLARFTGKPIDTARTQPDVLRRYFAAQTIDAETIARESPATAKVFADPNRMKLAMDDIANLRDLEGAARPSLVADIGTGAAHTGLKALGALDKAAVALNDSMPDGTPFKLTPQERDAYLQRGEAFQSEALDAPPQRWTGQVAAGLSYAPFLGAAPFVVAGAEGTARAQELEHRGVDAGTARQAGVAEGALQAFANFLPMGRFTLGQGVLPLAKSVGLAAGKSGAVGAGQSVASDTLASGILKDSGYGETAVAYAPSAEKAWESALFMGGLHLGMQGVHAASGTAWHKAARRLAPEAAQADAATRGAEMIQNLNDLAVASKLRTRDAETFKQFIEEATKDGPVENLYLDPRAFQQAGVDPAALAEALPSLKASLDVALATGGDVKIATADFATTLAGNDAGKALLPHLKADPNGMSKAEADTFMATQGERLKAEIEKTLSETTEDDAFNASRQRVHDEVLASLTETNRFSKDVNAPYARLHASFAAYMGARVGMTPEDFWRKHQARIVAEDMAGGFEQASRQPDAERRIESALTDKIGRGYEAAKVEYAALSDSQNGRVLSTDTARELSPDYVKDRTQSAAVHEPASAFIKRLYAEKLKEPAPKGQTNTVVFTAGGTGAGKTTAIKALEGAAQEIKEAQLIYDTNLNKYESAKDKIDQALAANKNVQILYVYRDPVDAMVNGALARAARQEAAYGTGRTVPLEEHVKTHVGSLEVIRRLAKEYEGSPDVEIKIIHNRDGIGASFTSLEKLPQMEYTDIHERLKEAIEKEYASGKISESVRSGFLRPSQKELGATVSGQHEPQHQGGRSDKLEQGQARGSYDPATRTIALLKASDLSTFLHESGHFFLDTLGRISSDPSMPADIRGDMDTALSWFGVKGETAEERLATWHGMSVEEQRPFHEQWARGFEKYLFEGKAPSLELQSMFKRFRAWLTNVYRNFLNLNGGDPFKAGLSADIRAVFDRMLASSEEIKAAETMRNLHPLFTDATSAGMTDEQFAAYHALGQQATQDAMEYLQTKALKDMRWLSNAKGRELARLQREAEGKRKAIRDEVTAEVLNEPINKARTFFKRGEIDGQKVEGAHRLDIDGLKRVAKDMYGDGVDAPVHEMESRFGKYGLLGKDGLDPDIAAEMFGFSSGSEMLHALINAENPREKIAGLVDQRMLERHGDLTDPAALQKAADEAVYNDARLRFVATEANALAKSMGQPSIIAEAARDLAGRMIGGLKVRNVRPALYATAAAKAARMAEKAATKGNIADAAAEKRNQLIQSMAHKEATRAREEVEKGVAYLKKFERDSVRKNISGDYGEQIEALLERFDLRSGQSLKAIDKRASLREWVKKMEEQGFDPAIDERLLDEAQKVHYKDMSVEAFRGLIDAVKSIEHIGRVKKRLLTAKDARELDAIVETLNASIKESAKGRVVDNATRSTAKDRAARLFKGFFASHRKAASLVREMDGFKDGGPFWGAFIRAMNEKGNEETTRRSEIAKDLLDIAKPVLALGRMSGKGQFFPSLGRSLNREERLALVLNCGNAGNTQRLLDGHGWTRDQIEPIIRSLGKEEVAFVQKVWNLFERFRPEIGALEKRINGKEPDWVEPVPLETAHGTLPGGYYPIKYDARMRLSAEQHDDANLAEQQRRAAFTSATTRRSFVKARAEEVKDMPLHLTLDPLYSGVNDVIHDLAWREWAIDANRLLRRVDGAMRDGYGADTARQLREAVKDITVGDAPIEGEIERVLSHLRSGAAISGLGFNIMNSVINLTGATQSVVRIGARWYGEGVAAFARSPVKLVQDIYDKSEFMRLRGNTLTREINDIRNLLRGKSAWRVTLDRLMFLPMTKTQILVDAPTWWGAYQKALAHGEVEDKAVALADQSVIDAQGSGTVKDLSAIQRGGSLRKLLTTFYGFFNTTWNLTVERTKATNFRDPLSVMALGGDYLLLYALPAFLGTAIKAAMQGDDSDEEAFARHAAGDQIGYLLGTVVGAREAAGAAQSVLGLSSFGYGGPAGLRFFNEIDKLGAQIKQGDLDRALLRSSVNVAGIAFHLPSAQINRTIDGIVAMADGKTSNPAALVAGGPRR